LAINTVGLLLTTANHTAWLERLAIDPKSINFVDRGPCMYRVFETERRRKEKKRNKYSLVINLKINFDQSFPH